MIGHIKTLQDPERTNSDKQESANGSKRWAPPRGIRLLHLLHRPDNPHAVQWRADGHRKTKSFRTKEAQEAYARTLAATVKTIGVAAYRLDQGEAMEWRAFRADIGDAGLDAVLACWRRHGQPRDSITVAEAVKQFLAAKKAEGIASTTLTNYKAVYEHFSGKYGRQDVGAIEQGDVIAFLDGHKVAGQSLASVTRRTYAVRLKLFFRWLKINRFLADSPCDGLKPPRVVEEEVDLLPVDQARALFAKSVGHFDRELLGRMALESFAGIRFGSACAVTAADIDFAARGITLPAAKIKTRRRQYIDGLPDNLWAWLEWSKPDTWEMTPIQVRRAKSLAFIHADVPHPHNVLRHSFASYHAALHKDASRTAAILCHTSPKMLYQHYKGRATEADGKAYFEIRPPA